MKKILPLSFALILTLACSIFAPPTPVLTIETLQARVTGVVPTNTASHPDPETATPSPAVPTRTATPANGPAGKIVFTCQVGNAIDQICIVNADGSGERQLTSESVKHWYPSLAPDGGSVLYSAYVKNYLYEIYELNLTSGSVRQLTDSLGIAKSPEVSPDGKRIIFNLGKSDDREEIWVMGRDGSYPKRLNKRGWDPTWSPDGSQILFASDFEGSIQLYVMNADGSGVKRITQFDEMRGRSDWSPDGAWMVTYNGPAWKRELFLFHPDFSELHQLSPSGGNSQGPSFSPDGKWVAFTAYYDHFGNDLGCEIYIIRLDGSDLRRLTDNAYCDYQPRWGN